MKTEIKGLWIEALRSGDYVQGRDCLKATTADGTTHCCLGVLCEVADIPFIEEDKNRYGVDYAIKGDADGFNNDAFLPVNLLKEFGLTNEQQIELADMNDGGMTFSEIADHIEQNL